MFKNYLMSFVIISTISLMANDKSKFYIGASYENGSTVTTKEERIYSNNLKDKEKVKGSMKAPSLTVGYIFDSSNRFEISYGSLKDNIDSFTNVQLTFLAPYHNHKILNLTPYWAIGTSLMTSKNFIMATQSGGKRGYDNAHATRFVGSLGFLYNIYENVEMGISYNFSTYSFSHTDKTGSPIDSFDTVMNTFVFNIKYNII